jgi:hypothetical protein
MIKKYSECFESLSMNGTINNLGFSPFILSTVEGLLPFQPNYE